MVIGKWLSKEVPVGQIAVLRNFFLPSRPVPPSPLDASLAVLRRPTFWTFATSAHPWASAHSPGGMVRSAVATAREPTLTPSDDAQDHQGHQELDQGHQGQSEQSSSSLRTKIKTTVKVQGRRCQQTRSRAARQRQFITARNANKMLKNGEQVLLAVVKRVGDVEQRSRNRRTGRMGAVRVDSESGPRKDFATVEEFRQEILGRVVEEHRDVLENILMEFNDVFPEKLPPGGPPQREVEIGIREMEGATPPTRPPYRLSPAEQAELEEQIQDLLTSGFIRPSVSPYGAPILFVPKKDGRWRMCIDYRALNK